jgi:hypothetical protein
MTRVYFIATFVIVSATAIGVGTGYSVPKVGLVVPASEAANVRGGQCGKYQLISDGACGDGATDSCTSSSTDCDGLCPVACGATSTYSGSGTFTGNLLTATCDTTTQPACTATSCTGAGVPIPCCACLGGSSVQCGPAPFTLDPQGCSGT